MLKFVTVNSRSNAKARTMTSGACTEKLVYREVKGDLFKVSPNTSLAHCVSTDLRMGKGIAVIFKKMFGGLDDLKAQGKKTGELAVLRRENRYVYYLVTKEKAWQKPKYNSLESSLQAMRKHCLEHNVSQLAMPKIGCGLDGLVWDKVAPMIRDVFRDLPITVTIYYL